jgi:predicted dehydrogenase
MKTLIAGLGSIGRRHFRNLVALGERDIILYRTHHATLPDDELAGFPVETDLAVALKKHQPDAVVVANPTALHMDVAIPAAKAGCTILLEKPVAESLERVRELESALRIGGGQLLVGFQFRFHPTLKKATELINTGAMGEILTVHAHWGEYLPDWHPWEDYRKSYAARSDLGGGVIVTLTHPLDYLRWLVGEVEALWSFNAHVSPLEVGVEDVAEIGLHFKNGAIGGVHLNYVQRPPTHRLEIVGTAGTLRWDNADGILKLTRIPNPFGTRGAQQSIPIVEQITPPAGFERNDMFVDLMRHFIAMVRGEAQSICTLGDGIRVLELALAARESQSHGNMVAWN